jgi:hypothetical protein
MFSAVPPEGVVGPDKTVSITVTFSTQQEITFSGHADILSSSPPSPF